MGACLEIQELQLLFKRGGVSGAARGLEIGTGGKSVEIREINICRRRVLSLAWIPGLESYIIMDNSSSLVIFSSQYLLISDLVPLAYVILNFAVLVACCY